MQTQSQMQPDASKSPLYGPMPMGSDPDQSFVGKIERKTEDVRTDVLSTLQTVNSQESADAAVQEAAQAVQAGDLSKEQFGKMVDELPSMVQGYVLGSHDVEGILPETKPLESVGMSEYDVEDADMTGKYTPGQLNKMPEMPQDKAA